MLNELSERELGVGFIYAILELFAERHKLTDVAVVLVNTLLVRRCSVWVRSR